MVSVGVRVVVLGVDFGSPALYPVLAEAGIPVVGGVPRLLQDYSAENARFFVGGSLTQLPALAAFAARELEADTVAVVTADALAGDVLARVFVIDPLERAGVEAIDLTAGEAEAALAPDGRAADADAVIVLADAASCAELASLAGSRPALLSGACEGLDVDSAGPRFYATEVLASDNGPFADSVAEDDRGGLAAVAFSAMVDAADILTRSYDRRGQPLDVLEVIDEQPVRDTLLGGPYRCDRRIELGPSVCGSSVAIVELGADAGPPIWIDGSDLLIDDAEG
jgi:hypothetical protein